MSLPAIDQAALGLMGDTKEDLLVIDSLDLIPNPPIGDG